jgi:UDP-N-acetylglucosamine--N-acetylmuramyl-(pentapeptide) pyrophosphoryl-undecaprenol N-acetylglucosamine transferase
MGYPLREDFQLIDRDTGRKRLGIPSKGKLLIVTGGSQGAKVLVDWVHCNEKFLAERHINVICLTGMTGTNRMAFHGASDGSIYQIRYQPFSDSMHVLYGAADLVICRAGAGTVAELIASARASILVPYPHAAGNHQMANALALEELGGAGIVAQHEMEKLLPMALELLDGDGAGAMERILTEIRSQSAGDPAGLLAEELVRIMEKVR